MLPNWKYDYSIQRLPEKKTKKENNNYSIEQLIEKVTSIAKKYGLGQCDKCAGAIQAFLSKEGEKYPLNEAVRITFNTGSQRGHYGLIYDQLGGRQAATTGLHEGILIDGIVYDNLYPEGLTENQWLKNYEIALQPEDSELLGLNVSGYNYGTFDDLPHRMSRNQII